MDGLVFGFVAGWGVIALASWLPKRLWLRVLGSPALSFTADVAVFALLFILHAGSTLGVLTATVGAAVAHVMMKCVRWWCGYISNNTYYPGVAHRNGWKRYTREELMR